MGAHVFFRGIRHNGAFQPLYRHLLSRTLYKRDARQTILGVRAYIPGDMPVDLQCLHTPYATSSLLPAPAPWPYIADFTRPEGLQRAAYCPQPPAPKGGLSREEEMKRQGCRGCNGASAPLMLIYFFQMLPFLVQLFAKSLNVDIRRILFLDCALLELAAFTVAGKRASPFFCSRNTS